MAYLNDYRESGIIRAQVRVLGALMLRDMMTRFGGSYLGYLIAIGWPLTHLGCMVLGYLFAQRAALVGTSVIQFVATGLVPYILFLYPSRWITLAVQANYPLLAFPIVFPNDIIFARVCVEIMTAFCVAAVFCCILFLCNVDLTPVDPSAALSGVFVTVLLGVSVGMLNCLLYSITRAWFPISIGVVIVMYLSSGALFLPSLLPENIQNILWFNPLFHCVEWLRSGYYEGYGEELLSKTYILGFCSVCILLCLAGERGFRGRFMTQ